MTPACHGGCAPGERLPWLRIGFSAFLAMNAMTLSLAVNLSETTSDERARLHLAAAALTAAVFGLLGGALIRGAWRAIRERRVSIDALFLLGIGGAVGGSAVASITGASCLLWRWRPSCSLCTRRNHGRRARSATRVDALLAVPAPGGAAE